MRSLSLALFLAALLSAVLLSRAASAQIVGNPGQTTFSTGSITYSNLRFSGDLNSLRIYWNASYLTPVVGQIGVRCYLNCNPYTTPNACAGVSNNCTYLGPPGLSVCTILPVVYAVSLVTPQNATCIFYNPAQPTVEYKNPDGSYPSSAFYPISFNLYLSPNFTVAVGNPVSMAVIVQNLGVFTDNYTQVVRAYPGNLIALDASTKNTTFGPVTGNSYGNSPQPFASLAKFTLLSTSAPVNLIVDINSTVNSTIDAEQVLLIQAGISSLPDFTWTGLLQIIALAGLILFFMSKKL